MHMINAGNQHIYQRELEDLFLARKQIFADGFGWKLPLKNGLDIDQFDDHRTNYFVGFDTRHNAIMSVRVRPTDDISLVGDLFGDALPADIRPINDGRTWEVTRGFCLEFGRKPWNLRRKAACMTAPFEVMQAQGMDRLVGFTDVRMFNFLVNMGWKLRILGDSVSYGEEGEDGHGAGFAFEIEVNEHTVAEMRAKWDLPDPAYVYIQDLLPGETVHDAALRVAESRRITDLLPREDLSRLRRGSRASATQSLAA